MTRSVTIESRRIALSVETIRALFGGHDEGTVRAGLSSSGLALIIQATDPDDRHGAFVSTSSRSFHAPRLVDALIAHGWANERYYLSTPAEHGRVVVLRTDARDPRGIPIRRPRNPDRTAHQRRHRAETAAAATRRDEPWTPAEDARILAFEQSARELALELGRTYEQVRHRRRWLTERRV